MRTSFPLSPLNRWEYSEVNGDTQNEQMASREGKNREYLSQYRRTQHENVRERGSKIKENRVIIKSSIDGWSLVQAKKQNVNHSNKHMLDEWRFIHCDIGMGSPAQIENHEAVIRAMREKFIWKLNLVEVGGKKWHEHGSWMNKVWCGWVVLWARTFTRKQTNERSKTCNFTFYPWLGGMFSMVSIFFWLTRWYSFI